MSKVILYMNFGKTSEVFQYQAIEKLKSLELETVDFEFIRDGEKTDELLIKPKDFEVEKVGMRIIHDHNTVSEALRPLLDEHSIVMLYDFNEGKSDE